MFMYINSFVNLYFIDTKFTSTSQGRNGTIQTYTIPSSGTYRIIAGGARGGKHVTSVGNYQGYIFVN